MTNTRPWIFLTLSLLATLSVILSIIKGSTYISFDEIVASIREPLSLDHAILINIRIPQTLTAFVTGGLLALAGALMQILLRNPLADPYVLGTSGGAAIITLVLMLFGITGLSLTLGAWIGSLASMGCVLFLARKKLSYGSDHLILTGVALSSGCAAIISLILFLSSDHVMRSMLFWLVGDLSETTIPLFGIFILVIGFIFSMKLATELNLLARGEKEALALGVNVPRLKMILILLCTILTATAVTLAGCVGFIGLIVPHALRLLCGHQHRLLFSGSILLGGTLLTCADTLSRTLLAPQQLPVGIIMTLLGIPVFLILLQKKT